MSGSPFEQALEHYSARLAVLAQPDVPLTREAVLAILVARDAVQAALHERPRVSVATMLKLTDCDNCLRGSCRQDSAGWRPPGVARQLRPTTGRLVVVRNGAAPAATLGPF